MSITFIFLGNCLMGYKKKGYFLTKAGYSPNKGSEILKILK